MSKQAYLKSGKKRPGFIIGALILGIIIAGALGEFALRLTNPVNVKALTSEKLLKRPFMEWAFVHPFAAYTPKPGKKFEIMGKTVNSHGFISTPELGTVEKPADAIRVAFLGGSSTAGTGRDLVDEQTWPWVTWQNLKKKYPEKNTQMINAAVNGYSTFESLGRMISQVRFFQPDVVVVYHGWNDMYYFDDASPEKVYLWRWSGDRDWGDQAVTIPPRMKPMFIDKLFGWSTLYGSLRLATAPVKLPGAAGEMGDKVREDHQLSPTFDPRGIKVMIRNLKQIKSTSELIGAKFFVAKQATLIAPDLAPEHKGKCYTWYHEFNYQAHIDAYNALWKAIDESFNPDEIIDTSGLTGNPKYFIDHVHPTPEGCAAIAGLVSEKIDLNSIIFKDAGQ